MSTPEFSFGDVVHDRDDDNPDEAVVVNTPPVTAGEWEVPAIEKTVAEDNPEYSEDAAVVVVVYRDHLDEQLPNWQDRDGFYSMSDLNENNVTHYSFPAPRLTPVDQEASGAEAGSTNREPRVRLDDLKDRLDDAAWETELANGVLTATKLGETYRIHDDGEIDGDGHVRESLGNIVAQYTE